MGVKVDASQHKVLHCSLLSVARRGVKVHASTHNDTNHLLIDCTKYEHMRKDIVRYAQENQIAMTVKNLLGLDNSKLSWLVSQYPTRRSGVRILIGAKFFQI
jgi:hypothetical protein